MNQISDNISLIQKNINDVCSRCGRSRDDVSLMVVSKTRSLEEIEQARSSGSRLFGENRVQEAVSKFVKRPDDCELHLIGHLQSNKIAQAVGLFHVIQSIDSLGLIKKMEKKLEDKTQRIYLEYNMSGDESKYGFTGESQFFESVDYVMNSPSFILDGLMTIGPLAGNETEIRRSFSGLRELSAKMRDRFPEAGCGLSMGMSSDYTWAIEEGSTMIRVGSQIFGARY